MKKVDLTDGLSVVSLVLTAVAGILGVVQTAVDNKQREKQIHDEVQKQLEERSDTKEET